MKKFLFLICVATAIQTTFCLNQYDTPKQRAAKKISAILNGITKAKTREEAGEEAQAFYDLINSCHDTNECRVTDESSKETLKKYNLIDAEGNVENVVCELLAHITNNPDSIHIYH